MSIQGRRLFLLAVAQPEKVSGSGPVLGSACVSRAGDGVLADRGVFFCALNPESGAMCAESSFRRHAENNTRDACATHSSAAREVAAAVWVDPSVLCWAWPWALAWVSTSEWSSVSVLLLQLQ